MCKGPTGCEESALCFVCRYADWEMEEYCATCDTQFHITDCPPVLMDEEPGAPSICPWCWLEQERSHDDISLT
jgi:hypothetical protein